MAITATAGVSGTLGVFIGREALGHSSGSQNRESSALPTATSQPTPPATAVTVVPSATSDGADNTAEPAGALPGAPSHVNEFGIPVGYPHTEPGAISACGNYVSAYMTTGNREPTRIRKILNSISTTGVADRLAKAITDTDTQTAKNFSVPSINSPQAAFNLRVVGYHTQTFTTTKASVKIWANSSVGVYDSTTGLNPVESWGTDICTVAWSGGDWKLVDAGNGPDGPAPTDRASEQFQRFVLQGAPA
ncbi:MULTISPECIES: hypothetical protein [unclassified Frankia]|uniref:hypothetical protein n=1 Tax=unclassified Frankia TaxID=2632575 RepID=UPI0027DE6FA7|nr:MULTISPECIES: hypothetical protein [unclassified Frankia]